MIVPKDTIFCHNYPVVYKKENITFAISLESEGLRQHRQNTVSQ